MWNSTTLPPTPSWCAQGQLHHYVCTAMQWATEFYEVSIIVNITASQVQIFTDLCVTNFCENFVQNLNKMVDIVMTEYQWRFQLQYIPVRTIGAKQDIFLLHPATRNMRPLGLKPHI